LFVLFTGKWYFFIGLMLLFLFGLITTWHKKKELKKGEQYYKKNFLNENEEK
jgi:uncharacterized membrane protein